MKDGWRRRDLWAVLAIVSATFAVYHRVLGNEFLTLWDDHLYVTGVQEIRHVTFANVRKIFTTVYVGHYAPVQMLSYMLDHALWGLRPFGFELTDVALHAASAALVFVLFRRCGYASVAAFAGALLFAIHPVQVESVAWISQRKTLLSMLFFLLTFLLYLEYRTSTGRARAACYLAANAAFVVALLSKPAAVVLPVVLVLHDVLLAGDRPSWRLLRDKLPFAATTLAAAGLAVWTQSAELHGGRAPGWHGGSPYHTALTMVPVFRAYLGKLVWPAGLSVLYAPEIKTHLDADVLLSAVVLMAVIAAPWLLARGRRRHAIFWLGVSILGLIPVSQVVPLLSLMNDRYLYYPLLGTAGGVALLLSSTPVRWRAAGAALAIALAVPLGVASFTRTRAWASSVTLWADAAEKSPRDATVWYGLGLARDNAGDLESAIRAYERAIEVRPDYVDALYNLALARVARGELDEARRALQRLLAANPEAPDATQLLGHVLYCEGDFPGALAVYELAERRAPGDPDALNYASLAASAAGDRVQAEAFLAEALRRGGDRARLLVARASLESLAHREAPALANLEAAVQAGYNDVEALRQDRDLAFVRESAGFSRLVARMKREPTH